MAKRLPRLNCALGVVGYRKLRSQPVNFRFAPESSATRKLATNGESDKGTGMGLRET